MARVLWVYEYLSVHAQRLATQLVRSQSIDLEIMCRFDAERPNVPSSVPVTQLVCKNKLDFTARRQIRNNLEAGKFDLAHAHSGRNLASLVGACRGLKPMPKIVGYRGVINRLYRVDPTNWLTFWHPRLAHITCVCQATQQALLESGVPASKLSVVWSGCDPATSLPPTAKSTRASFDIPDNAFVVGVVANMRPVKGIDLLLQAALQLAELKDIYWLLIGEVRDPGIRV